MIYKHKIQSPKSHNTTLFRHLVTLNPPGVRGWLWLLLVALSGLFYLPFWRKCTSRLFPDVIFIYCWANFSMLVKKKVGWCFLPYCLLANVIPRQPYVRLTSKSKITRKKTSLSYNFLRDSNHLKFQKVCIKSDVMFSGKHLVTLWRLHH